MADDADIAAMLAEVDVSSRVSRIDAAVPAGIAGECDDCGEVMPRLVGGRYGYCRDGRRPPLSRYDGLAPALPVVASPTPAIALPKESTPVSEHLNISIHVRSEATIAALRDLTAAGDTTLGRVAVGLIEEALAVRLAPPMEGTEEQIDELGFANASVDDLVDALRARLAAGVSPVDYEAALTRAEVAESQLALIGGVLSGHVRPAQSGVAA